MTQDEIIRMAREAGFGEYMGLFGCDQIERFAALIAAHEREKQAEQEPVNKALRIAEEALVYHTEQTRPIQKTDEAIIYLRNVMTQGVLNMTFTLKDAMAKYPEISYWHSEFIKHNTTDAPVSIEAAILAEREACAKVADGELMNTNMLTSYPPKSSAAWNIAAAIRARGEK